MYGGVRGRKTKIGGKPTFVFLLLDSITIADDIMSKAPRRLPKVVVLIGAGVPLLFLKQMPDSF